MINMDITKEGQHPMVQPGVAHIILEIDGGISNSGRNHLEI